jgi:hypothetical protein
MTKAPDKTVIFSLFFIGNMYAQNRKNGKPNNLKVLGSKKHPKGLNKIAKFG